MAAVRLLLVELLDRLHRVVYGHELDVSVVRPASHTVHDNVDAFVDIIQNPAVAARQGNDLGPASRIRDLRCECENVWLGGKSAARLERLSKKYSEELNCSTFASKNTVFPNAGVDVSRRRGKSVGEAVTLFYFSRLLNIGRYVTATPQNCLTDTPTLSSLKILLRSFFLPSSLSHTLPLPPPLSSYRHPTLSRMQSPHQAIKVSNRGRLLETWADRRCNQMSHHTEPKDSVKPEDLMKKDERELRLWCVPCMAYFLENVENNKHDQSCCLNNLARPCRRCIKLGIQCVVPVSVVGRLIFRRSTY